MLKQINYIIWLLILLSFQSNGQNLLRDSLEVWREKGQYPFVYIPPYYDELSHQLNLPNIKDSDSFSLRLWTGSIFGYGIFTFTRHKDVLESHKYEYDSSFLKELKIKPKMALSDFSKAMQVFNFNSLITQYQIKDFQDNVDDGTIYTLEIIKDNSYKVVQYHSPELFADSDNKKFTVLLNIIEKYDY